jgi:hypothetical protein
MYKGAGKFAMFVGGNVYDLVYYWESYENTDAILMLTHANGIPVTKMPNLNSTRKRTENFEIPWSFRYQHGAGFYFNYCPYWLQVVQCDYHNLDVVRVFFSGVTSGNAYVRNGVMAAFEESSEECRLNGAYSPMTRHELVYGEQPQGSVQSYKDMYEADRNMCVWAYCEVTGEGANNLKAKPKCMIM